MKSTPKSRNRKRDNAVLLGKAQRQGEAVGMAVAEVVVVALGTKTGRAVLLVGALLVAALLIGWVEHTF